MDISPTSAVRHDADVHVTMDFAPYSFVVVSGHYFVCLPLFLLHHDLLNSTTNRLNNGNLNRMNSDYDNCNDGSTFLNLSTDAVLPFFLLLLYLRFFPYDHLFLLHFGYLFTLFSSFLND